MFIYVKRYCHCYSYKVSWNCYIFEFVQDAAISIAVIHHLASPERRLNAIKELVRILKPKGQALITVWAHEQKRFADCATSDVFVPWQLRVPNKSYHSAAKVPPATDVGKVDRMPSSDAGEVLGEPSPKRQKLDRQTDKPQETTPRVFQRYYHLFEKGELEKLIEKVPHAKVVKSEFDHDNWYVLLEKL